MESSPFQSVGVSRSRRCSSRTVDRFLWLAVTGGDGPTRGCSPLLREPVAVGGGCFTHPSAVTRPVLEDLSLSIRAGDVIAVIGRTAAARQRLLHDFLMAVDEFYAELLSLQAKVHL